MNQIALMVIIKSRDMIVAPQTITGVMLLMGADLILHQILIGGAQVNV